MQIGSLQLKNPFILAPLAGYTDLAFRLLCRRFGAALCFSEMISCHGLFYNQNNTFKLLQTHVDERPVVMQLFGADPEIMGRAAAVLDRHPIDGIDINMGCPVRKVIKKNCGAALMKDLPLAAKIIRQVKKNTNLPVTVKFRSGWNHQNINAVEFARMAEESGASALTIHARTWSDGFSGRADRRIIKDVKEAVSLPVIGNGDILSYQDGLTMMQTTGCDGVMIGRGALGAPWVFSADTEPDPSLRCRLTALLQHLDLVEKYHAPSRMLAKMKNHAGRYIKSVPRASQIRQSIYTAETFTQLKHLIVSSLEKVER